MGGRVIPFFTERGVAGVTTKKWLWIERFSSLSVILMVLGEVFFTDSIAIGEKQYIFIGPQKNIHSPEDLYLIRKCRSATG